MWGKTKRENLLLKTRVKELENILCPGEQHTYKEVSHEDSIIDEYCTCLRTTRYVCTRCFKAIEEQTFE